MNRKTFACTILSLLFFVLSSCEKAGMKFDEWIIDVGESLYDDELTLERQPFLGNELKTNGYYYYMNEGQIFDSYIFYKNGVIIHGKNSSPYTNNDPIGFMDGLFLSDSLVNDLSKFNYGIFQIQGDSIWIEKWIVFSGNRRVLLLSGNILNDTSFVLTRSENTGNGNVFHMNKLFHFHALTPKPDSTNTFIP